MAVATAGERLTVLERVLPHDVLRWVELIRNLAVRDVETRYKHSLLGLYWTLINPLVTALIFSFVFQDIFHATSKPVPYVVFLLSGLTFWNFFNNGVYSATSSVTGNAQLLAKLYFPRVVLPTAAVLARMIDFAFGLVILLVFFALYRVPLHWIGFLLIAPILLLQVMFTMGIAFITSALNVLYRDMSQLIGLLLMVWMYMSPVMFHPSSAPAELRLVFYINPVGAMISAEKDLLFTGQIGHPLYLWFAVLWTMLVYAAGLRLFKRIEPLFAEVM